jgi:toxin ParE1/3/4
LVSGSLHRFPFTLIYAPSSHVLYVLAVAHDRRRPGYWLSRR